MLLRSKVRFYLSIGLITALPLFFIVSDKISLAVFITSAAIYFLLGLFLGWRVECKVILASILMLIPLTLFAAYLHFVGTIGIIKYIYAIAFITFFIGFLLSKFWNSKYRMLKLLLILLLIVGIGCSLMIYNKAVYGDWFMLEEVFNFL